MSKKRLVDSDLLQAPAGAMGFPDEIIYLEQMNGWLCQALAEAKANVRLIDQQYLDSKRYMAQYRGEIDPHEMFQNELGLKQIDTLGAFAVTVLDKIEKLKDSPYFARIDFCLEANQQTEVFYIGRFAFNYNHELLILDWRSPAAGMFYDCELGAAGYTAPEGRINGVLTRKRQFKIKNGEMVYVLESSVNIQDSILQQELSQTADEKMKSIIATIQKEQNQIIRNEKTSTLIIQGVAGSGKTSIALHRIAFLLYRYRDSLSARNVTIVSPNKVFGDYIANVLPELGEEPIYEVSLEDIAKIQMVKGIQFERDKAFLDKTDPLWAERVGFKSTLSFLRQMDSFINQMPGLIFTPEDYTYEGFTIKAQVIQLRFQTYSKYPVKRRLQMVAEDICDRIQTENFRAEDIPKASTVLKALNKMLRIKNTLTLYKEFYKHYGIENLLVMPAKKTLEWADVYPFLYLHGAFEGLKESSVIKHLVIDEMQDYTPVQYGVINLLFNCPKTILGDFGQSVNPNHLHTLADLKLLYGSAAFVELRKSYRSTFEIISFAKQLKDMEAIEAVERHGEVPKVIKCFDVQDELTCIKKEITAFLKKGYSSLAIITKTHKDAEQFYHLLGTDHDIYLITPESVRFTNGVSVTSIQMSKGLEFDAVIIPDVNKKTYSTEHDRNLLYVACTRAMHRLMLLYTGEASPFIGI